MDELTSLSIAELREGYKKGDFSPVEVVKAFLRRIEKVDAKLRSYLFVNEKVIEEAKKLRPGNLNRQPLWGIPYSAKDLFLTKGLPTTAGSKILENFIAPYESTVTKRLKKAGGLLLGKTNLDEFAMGSSTERSAFQITRNPWDLERVPGGSSGGSASAVSAGLCVFSVGTDTGGSIRQPASFCGIFGLKPTYGRVSRYGIIAMASSLDQAGPMSFSVRDSAEVLKVISGFDPLDATSSLEKVPNYSEFLERSVKGMKIGVVKEAFGEGLDERVKEKVLEVIQRLKQAGCQIKEVSLPRLPYALAIYYILMPAEVSSNLARYDGLRYGLSAEGMNLSDVYERTRKAGFGEEVKRRIILGTFVLSAGYKEAYYLSAQKARTALRKDFLSAFKEVELLLLPTSPVLPFKIGERIADPLQMYLADIYTVPINPAGLPSASIPCGFVKKGKKELPVGFQLVAPHFKEEKIFQVASAYEKLHPEAFQRPKI
ncbi:Asp-tRNA(Asn)/Glu-tRNA(Gln) amidotransferase subunit GatA [bacterium]|nr:Asp-tRNA(Asn)/Glu-tRNA(Gln) amidotransferase subunit GatA [bacterium]